MNLKKIAGTVLLAGAIVVGTATPALATADYVKCQDGYQSVGGGCWYHTGGQAGDYIKSRYKHSKACHSATAKNANGTKDKDVAPAKSEARASVKATDDVDYSYWDNEATGC